MGYHVQDFFLWWYGVRFYVSLSLSWHVNCCVLLDILSLLFWKLKFLLRKKTKSNMYRIIFSLYLYLLISRLVYFDNPWDPTNVEDPHLKYVHRSVPWESMGRDRFWILPIRNTDRADLDPHPGINDVFFILNSFDWVLVIENWYEIYGSDPFEKFGYWSCPWPNADPPWSGSALIRIRCTDSR